MRCITANVLQTGKVDAQCDKLATELSRQPFASKVANLQLSHLLLTYVHHSLGAFVEVTPFAAIFGIRELDTMEYISVRSKAE